MGNITIRYYDNVNGLQTIPSHQIKSVKVIGEIDITHMTAPTTAIDIILKCTQDDDLEFDIDSLCDVYSGETALFEMYVSNSVRNSNYEWKLSLCGTLGHTAYCKYYGGVYGDPTDYISLSYYQEDKYYVPYILSIEGIREELSTVADVPINIDVEVFPEIEELLHQVGMSVCNVRDACLLISFVLGAYIKDMNREITFYKPSEKVKEIPDYRIINDAKLEKLTSPNLRLYSYKYNMLRGGAVWLKTYTGQTDSEGKYIYSYDAAYYCNLVEYDTYRANNGNFELRVGTKTADDDTEMIFDAPVSSINMPILNPWDGSTFELPAHPNYSPKNEELTYPMAVKYDIRETVTDIVIHEDTTETSDIKVSLLSPQMATDIAERVKSDFSYNKKALVKIVESFDKVYYGEHNYGEVTYGYTGQESVNLGDRVKFNVRNKPVEGIVTRVSYNLNGTIKIKDCEVMYKE